MTDYMLKLAGQAVWLKEQEDLAKREAEWNSPGAFEARQKENLDRSHQIPSKDLHWWEY